MLMLGRRQDNSFLEQDIQDHGYTCTHYSLEIGMHGLVTRQNKGTITHLCNLVKERKIMKIISTLSKLTLL